MGGVWILVGLGYGDEGKGTMVDYLVRRTGAGLVVRFNGGPQAAHHVVLPNGVSHCFSQFGSGSFVPGRETWLAGPVFVDPLALVREGMALREKGVPDPFPRLIIDPECRVVTPYHALLNQMQEIVRDTQRHGSCGRGLGCAFADSRHPGRTSLQIKDLLNRPVLPRLLQQLREEKLAQAQALLATAPPDPRLHPLADQLATPELPPYLARHYHHILTRSGVRLRGVEYLAHCLRAGTGVVFEGAQGILLDMEHGFWPHVTPSHTTVRNAMTLLAASHYSGPVSWIGVLRAYASRHGEGPFVTQRGRLASLLPEPHNSSVGWQGPMRVGWLDAVATRYALAANGGVDGLALTCLDRLAGLPGPRLCERYRIAETDRAYPRDLATTLTLGPAVGAPRLREIPLLNPQHFTSRTRLTELLYRCRPCYAQTGRRIERDAFTEATLGGTATSYLEQIETAVGQAIDLVSIGPTPLDKIVRSARS